MAEPRLRVVVTPPGGEGVRLALHACARSGSIVSAYSDAKLRVAGRLRSEEFDFEPVPFGDLVGQVLRMAGVSERRLATLGQRQAIAQLACETLPGETAFERGARRRGAARLIGERLGDLAQFGLNADALRGVASAVSPHLGSRLESMAVVADLVRDSLDTSSRETVLDRVLTSVDLGTIETGPFNHLVVFTGPDDQPAYDGWLVWLASQGVSVDVVVELVPARQDIFLPGQRTIARLGPTKRLILGGDRWFESMFTDEVPVDGPSSEVFEAADPLAECEWTLRRCRSLIDGGVPARRIGVFVRDTKTYTPLLLASAQRLRVPLSVIRSAPLLSSGAASAVLALLEACGQPDVRHLARLGANKYFETPEETLRLLQQKCSEFSKGGRDGWEPLAEWVKSEECSAPWFVHSVAWAAEARVGVCRLSKWLDRLRTLVGEAVAPTGSCRDVRVANRDERAQTVLQRSIADIAFVYDQAGERELGLAQFIELARSRWDNETVAVREGEDGVVVCSDENALDEFHSLFVPGMLEGTLPRRRSEDPILSDEDLKELTEASGIWLPDSRDRSLSERDTFVRVCAAASNHLVMSFPMSDGERDNIPAFYLEELERLLPSTVRTLHSRATLAPPLSACVAEADKRLRAALDGPTLSPRPATVTKAWAVECLRPDWSKGVTPEELGKSLTCLFSSTFARRLGVAVRGLPNGVGLLSDLPRSAGIAQAATPETAHQALSDELGRLLDSLMPRLEKWEISLFRATGGRLCSEWVRREFASRETWPREETFADVPLGERGLRHEVSVGGRAISLKARLRGAFVHKGVSFLQMSGDGSGLRNADTAATGLTEDAFIAGLYLMSQIERSPAGCGIEFDSKDGRVLFALTKRPWDTKRDVAHGMTVRHVPLEWNSLFRAVRGRLVEAVEKIETADCRATPGAHCEGCSYAQMCRVSQEFGGIPD